ncbi:hypothetical protein Dimus_002922, partial [Dionaea muscipula]
LVADRMCHARRVSSSTPLLGCRRSCSSRSTRYRRVAIRAPPLAVKKNYPRVSPTPAPSRGRSLSQHRTAIVCRSRTAADSGAAARRCKSRSPPYIRRGRRCFATSPRTARGRLEVVHAAGILCARRSAVAVASRAAAHARRRSLPRSIWTRAAQRTVVASFRRIKTIPRRHAVAAMLLRGRRPP